MIIRDLLYQFLRRTQKYTGTDNVYLAESSFWITLGHFASMAISFISAVAFGNLLDPAIYGIYKYILSLVGLLGIFSLQGTKWAIVQATARGFEKSFYTAFQTKLKWGLLGSLAAVLAAIYYWTKGNTALTPPLLMTAAFLPLMEASQVYSSFLNGKKLFSVEIKYSILKQIISAIAVIAVLLTTKNIFWLIAAYLASNTLLNYFFYGLTKIKFKPNKNDDPQTITFAKQLSLMGIISVIENYLDKILLFTFIGPSQLAVYAFASLIPENITNIFLNIGNLAIPKFAVKSLELIKNSLLQKLWKIFFLIGAITISYVLIAPIFYRTFFPKYLDSIPYSQVLILSLLLVVPADLISNVFYAKIMKREIYIMKGVISISRVLMFLVLTPLMGIWGLVIAKIGGGLINFVLSLFLLKRIG